MWRKLPAVNKQQASRLRRLKRAKLYADEDIEEGAVEYLREQGANIESARELGYRGKPDSFHVAYASKRKRFILTKNAKHFLTLPFHRLHGVIVIEGDMGEMYSYATVLLHVLDIIVPFGGGYVANKITMRPHNIVRTCVEDGRIVTVRYKFERGEIYEWVPEP